MGVQKELKNKVAIEWQEAFPDLKLYSPNALYKIAGCIIIGIELIKLPRSDEFRPHLIMYPLWEKDIKECFARPILQIAFFNKKKLQFSIPYEKNGLYIPDVKESIKSQASILFDETVSLSKVIAMLNEYSNSFPLNAAANSYLQAKVQEAKLLISLYKDKSRFEGLIAEINKVNWNGENFKYFKEDVNRWLSDMKEKPRHRDAFLRQVEINKLEKKLLHLHDSELV